ncbi:hypothetical protein M758_2G058500 [Ceratodon purpureus]|nr:hypothetical protein M758_2G058500 [Ceratodon purpureus]
MATNGSAAPAAKPEGKRPEGKKPEGSKRVKDETIAKAAGAVIAGGILWSLFKSVTGRGKRQQVHIEGHTTKEKDTLSNDIKHTAEHAGKEIESKAKGIAHGAEHKGIDLKHSIEAAGSKISQFGHKKLDGKTIEVHKGDTLWGIARKYNVTVEALMATNGIKNGDNISAGESIVVPK